MSVSIQKQPGMAWLYWAVVDPRHAWMNVSTQKPPGMARRYRQGVAGQRPALPPPDQAKLSVARTSASTFSASNAEWPEAGVISSFAFGHTLVRSQALASGQTTS